MFGLTESEMNLYRDITQDFAIQDISPIIITNAKFITPPLDNAEGNLVPDRQHVAHLASDVETIITLTASHMAYEYAYLQCDTPMTEQEIIKHLHDKYEDFVVKQFIKYAITFTMDTVTEIVGGIVLELPYLYSYVIQDEDFDEDSFLDEKLQAYNDYLNENFSEGEEEDLE